MCYVGCRTVGGGLVGAVRRARHQGLGGVVLRLRAGRPRPVLTRLHHARLHPLLPLLLLHQLTLRAQGGGALGKGRGSREHADGEER